MFIELFSSYISFLSFFPGHNFTVPGGTTVYLPCKTSDKMKQRWAFKSTPQSRKEFISTLYKNSTLKKERADPTLRFTHTTDHLIISDLQLRDSGLYLCNNREMAFLTVTTGRAEHNINTEYTIYYDRNLPIGYSCRKSMIPCNKKVSTKYI